jgi:hypothetical protein
MGCESPARRFRADYSAWRRRNHQMITASNTKQIHRRPRRGWGWTFLIAFFLQAVFFAFAVAGVLDDIAGRRHARQSFIASGNTGEDMVNFIGSQIAHYNNQLYLTLLAAAVCSVGTVAGAMLCFRRRDKTEV